MSLYTHEVKQAHELAAQGSERARSPRPRLPGCPTQRRAIAPFPTGTNPASLCTSRLRPTQIPRRGAAVTLKARMRFYLTGSPSHCSREYVRAWLQASACVLAYHNKILPPVVRVEFVDFINEGVAGQWSPTSHKITLLRNLRPEQMATVILHEVIHAACGDDTDEKCCSTLTARLKPEVQLLAQPLVDRTYKRAAFIAHTKLSYVTDEDHYDKDQWGRVGAKDRHGRRRRKAKLAERYSSKGGPA